MPVGRQVAVPLPHVIHRDGVYLDGTNGESTGGLVFGLEHAVADLPARPAVDCVLEVIEDYCKGSGQLLVIAHSRVAVLVCRMA